MAVSDEFLQAVQVITYNVVVTPYLGMEDTYPDTYYYYANYFVVSDPSKAVITDTGGITHAVHGDSLVIPVPAGADLMQAQMVVPMEVYNFNYTDPNPLTSSSTERWSMTAFDWEDRNGDGKLWEDTNADGIVNPQFDGDGVDVSYLFPITQTEINRFAYSYIAGNEQEVTVRLTGADRTGANTPKIVLGLVHRYNNAFRNMGTLAATQKFYQDNPLQVKVIFYKKADVPMVTESVTSLSVPAGGSATFNAVFSIPPIAPPGLYDGAIVLNDGTHKTLVPTTVNVAVPSDKLLFTLGGTPAAGTPYDNGRGFGAWTYSTGAEQGDWRFFFYDAQAGFAQQSLYVRNQWGQLCGNMPTHTKRRSGGLTTETSSR